MPCGKRSTLPRGPDLVKDQDELEVCYHPLRVIPLFVPNFMKGKIDAKTEKGKNVKVKTTEENLRMKLRRFKQEIREMGETKIEKELATAAAQAKSTALDAEFAAKMTRYAIMNEGTTAMRKEHNEFKNDITMRLQKLRGKYSCFNQEANASGKKCIKPEAIK
uniref:Uncharacterized protein n=1 Tax=Solanum tuberosum TaxID=4113 RepID=M1CPJ7_SOLTU